MCCAPGYSQIHFSQFASGRRSGSNPERSSGDDRSLESPAVTSPAMRKRVWPRCGVGLSIAASVISFGILSSIPPTGTAVAQCFQRGGYNPPPCDTTPPTTASASPGGSSSPDTTQSSTGSTATSTSSPPDSSVTACQNQSAMAINIGLQPVPCPSSQPGSSPPDSGVTACQNQSAMANNIGLQPLACPPSAPTSNGT